MILANEKLSRKRYTSPQRVQFKKKSSFATTKPTPNLLEGGLSETTRALPNSEVGRWKREKSKNIVLKETCLLQLPDFSFKNDNLTIQI
jgi:hypothetical protein